MQSDHSRSSPSFGRSEHDPADCPDNAAGRYCSKCEFAGDGFAVPIGSAGMRLVVLESPFRGGGDEAIAYAKRAIHDALMRGEAPIASHLLFTQPGILDDEVPGERALGIEAGLAWYRVAQACVAYVDHGVSAGMRQGMERARSHGVEVELRRIGQVGGEPAPANGGDLPLCGV